MTALTQAITEALLHSIWQGVLVASLLWITLFLLRTRSANARYLASTAALFGLFELSLITVWMVYETPRPLVLESSADVWIPSDPAVPWVSTAKSWAFPLWAGGVALFSLRLIWAYAQISRWRSQGTPGDAALSEAVARLAERMGIRRHVDVLISSLADAPGMIGWLRPILLVPAATVSGLTPQQLELILAHELAHIRRHDYLVNIGQMIVETLLFYHPAIWWASRQIRRERELACDDLAVESMGDALSYARALTALEKTRVLAPDPAMGSTRGPLMYRIQRLVTPEGREPGPSKLAGVTVLFLLGVTCLFLTISWASAQTTKKQTQAKPPAPAVAQKTPAPQAAPSRRTSELLKAELSVVKANLERAEDKLQAYSRSNGLLLVAGGLEENGSSEVSRLKALQAALTAAQIEKIGKEAALQVAEEEIDNLGKYNAELIKLRREDARLAATLSPDSPKRKEIGGQIEVIERTMREDARAAIERARSEQRVTFLRQTMINAELEKQQSRVDRLAEDLAQYQILKREAEANRQVYETLLKKLMDAQ